MYETFLLWLNKFSRQKTGSECRKTCHERNSHKLILCEFHMVFGMWISHEFFFTWNSSKKVHMKNSCKIHVEFALKFSHKFLCKCLFHMNIFTWISHAPLWPMNKWLGMTYHYCCWSRIAVRERVQGQTGSPWEVSVIKKYQSYCSWLHSSTKKKVYFPFIFFKLI